MVAPDLCRARGDGRGCMVRRSRQGGRRDAPRPTRGPDRLRSRRADDRRDARRHGTVAAAIRVSRLLKFDALTVPVDDVDTMARAAAVGAAEALQAAIAARGEANVMLATGNPQLAFLVELVQLPAVEWNRVRA